MERHRNQGGEQIRNCWVLEESEAYSWGGTVVITRPYYRVSTVKTITHVSLGIANKPTDSYLMIQNISHHLQSKGLRSHSRVISDPGSWTAYLFGCMHGIQIVLHTSTTKAVELRANK